MPKSPDTSTVSETGNQKKVTIPKPLAEQLGLKKGQKVRWRVLGPGRLEMKLTE